jgi:predicted lactoylglutathione lyase
MLVRDRGLQPDGHRRGHPYWAWQVFEVPEITVPQGRENHWGVDLATNADVDRAHGLALAHKDRLGFKVVQKPRDRHGSYAFMIKDFDSNWMEVECHPRSADAFHEGGGFQGDCVARTDDGAEYGADNPLLTPIFMSHGTIRCGGNGNAARNFYTEFLGIGAPLREGYRSGGFASYRPWYVACLPVGAEIIPQPEEIRWVFAVNSLEELQGFEDSAREFKDRYRIREIQPIQKDGDASFVRLQDLDGNWFEYQWRAEPMGRWFDAEFELGDVA